MGLRTGISINVGVGIGSGVGVVDASALSFVAPSAVLAYQRADLGVTVDGSNRVSAWADQSGNGKHFTQGTAGLQPLWSPTGGPNSKAAVQLDTTAREMTQALALPAPGTTPTLIWLVWMTDAWSSNSRLVGSEAASTKHLIFATGLTPQLSIYNATQRADNTAGTVGSAFRIEAYFSNSAADRLKIGATSQTGASAGNNASASRILGLNASALTLRGKCMEILYLNRDATAGEKTALDAYVTSRYGAGLV